MGMTNNQKRLIEAIAKKDHAGTRKAAIACCVEDKTAKNKSFCEHYQRLFENGGPEFLELPIRVRPFLVMEDVSQSFKPNRYYLSERELAVRDHIISMKSVSEQLCEMGGSIPYSV